MSDWNDEFDAFDIDLSGTARQASEAAAPEGAETSATESDGAATDALPSDSPAAPADTDGPQGDGLTEEDEDAREALAEEEALARQKEREQQRAARREERQKGRMVMPRTAPQSTTADELQQTVDELGQCALSIKAMVIQLRKQLANTESHRPKGVKSAIRRMEAATEVLLATRSIVSTVAQTSYPAAIDALKSSRLLKDISRAQQSIKRWEPKMAACIGGLKQATEASGDNASDIAREMKQQAMKLERQMQDLACSLHQATDAYPDEHGRLALFEIIAQEGNEEAMLYIDNTMQIAGQVVVHVADAPAMIAALSTNDQQTIDDIIRRAVDSFPSH